MSAEFWILCVLSLLLLFVQGFIISTVEWRERWRGEDVFGFLAIELIVLATFAGAALGAMHVYRRDTSRWQSVCDEWETQHGMVMVGNVAVPTTYQACVRSHYECPDHHCGELP